jgi:hypothetical protein
MNYLCMLTGKKSTMILNFISMYFRRVKGILQQVNLFILKLHCTVHGPAMFITVLQRLPGLSCIVPKGLS